MQEGLYVTSVVVTLGFARFIKLSTGLASVVDLSLDDMGSLDGQSNWVQSRVILGYQGPRSNAYNAVELQTSNVWY